MSHHNYSEGIMKIISIISIVFFPANKERPKIISDNIGNLELVNLPSVSTTDPSL